MVQFKRLGSFGSYDAIIDGVVRFKVQEAKTFAGGWVLKTLDGKEIKTFPFVGELETYIEEMDK